MAEWSSIGSWGKVFQRRVNTINVVLELNTEPAVVIEDGVE